MGPHAAHLPGAGPRPGSRGYGAGCQVGPGRRQGGPLGGKKTVATPISEVESLDDGVSVRLDREQVLDLPPVDVHALA